MTDNKGNSFGQNQGFLLAVRTSPIQLLNQSTLPFRCINHSAIAVTCKDILDILIEIQTGED